MDRLDAMTTLVAAGALWPVLRPFELEKLPVQLVYNRQSLVPLKLRAFLDFAAPRLKEALATVSV
nr:hypothetical protein [uncultured Rhodopila sp.]